MILTRARRGVYADRMLELMQVIRRQVVRAAKPVTTREAVASIDLRFIAASSEAWMES